MIEFIHTKDHEQMSQIATRFFVDTLKDILEEKHNASIILSAGKTHERAYEILTEQYRNAIEWERVAVFHMDEYLNMSPDDPRMQQNRLMRMIISKLPFKYFYPFGKYTPSEYEHLISNHFPIDIAFQGVGVNGHYGFNEPPSERDSSAREVILHPSTLTNNNLSIEYRYAKTLGLNITKSIRHHAVLLSGKHKKDVFDRLTNIDNFDPNLPISILHETQNVKFFYNL